MPSIQSFSSQWKDAFDEAMGRQWFKSDNGHDVNGDPYNPALSGHIKKRLAATLSNQEPAMEFWPDVDETCACKVSVNI